MAQYTLTMKQIIENKVDIFKFNYPIFEESYREEFEKKFIKHFYFREIGVETVGRFIFNLDEMLNLIMPRYNKMYKSQRLELRILDNYSVTETFDKSQSNNTTGSQEVENTSNNESKNLYSDTPKKKIDIDTTDFVTNITKDVNRATGVSSANNIVNDIGSEKWIRTMEGNIGVQTDSDAVENYEKRLRNIDLEIFNELEILFMGVY